MSATLLALLATVSSGNPEVDAAIQRGLAYCRVQACEFDLTTEETPDPRFDQLRDAVRRALEEGDDQ